jgi:hypothetical protein
MIDLRALRTVGDASMTFLPARRPADGARREADAAADAAACAQRAAAALHEPQRRPQPARARERRSARRAEILAGWLVALALLLGIAAWSLMGSYRADGVDAAVRPIVRGAPAANAPASVPRDDLAAPPMHEDE